MSSPPQQPAPDRGAIVLVTATTEMVRGRQRVRLNEAYVNALAGAGLVPLVVPPLDGGRAVAALGVAQGLVLTGGEDLDPATFGEIAHPATGAPNAARDACELALARAAFEWRIPTLAICRGAQLVNVALGGTLVQDVPSECPGALLHEQSNRRTDRVHGVHVDAGSRLASIVGATQISTNSSHHQAIARVAPALRVTARADDAIVEAAEPIDGDWWMIAVQWHPEELAGTTEDWDRRLFAAFAAATSVASAPHRVPAASGAPASARLERAASR